MFNIAVGDHYFDEDEYGRLKFEETKHWEKNTMEVNWLKVYQ